MPHVSQIWHAEDVRVKMHEVVGRVANGAHNPLSAIPDQAFLHQRCLKLKPSNLSRFCLLNVSNMPCGGGESHDACRVGRVAMALTTPIAAVPDQATSRQMCWNPTPSHHASTPRVFLMSQVCCAEEVQVRMHAGEGGKVSVAVAAPEPSIPQQTVLEAILSEPQPPVIRPQPVLPPTTAPRVPLAVTVFLMAPSMLCRGRASKDACR